MAKQWTTSREERIKWLLANPHLWGEPKVLAMQMAKAGLYAKSTAHKDIKRGVASLIEDARDVLSGTTALSRYAKHPPDTRPKRPPRRANGPLGPVTGPGSGGGPPPDTETR